jgi:hypothetical protein
MNQDWTLKAWKKDKRTKTGERLVNTSVVKNTDEQTIKANLKVGLTMNPGYRFEYCPATKTVTNLMSGKEVVIPTDTPRSCDPSSELYWSM